MALSCGFRESGINICQKKILVAIRTSAFGMEIPVCFGTRHLTTSYVYSFKVIYCLSIHIITIGANTLVKEEAMPIMVEEVNSRLRANFSRMDRLLQGLKDLHGWPHLVPQLEVHSGSRTPRRWGHVSLAVGDDSLVTFEDWCRKWKFVSIFEHRTIMR